MVRPRGDKIPKRLILRQLSVAAWFNFDVTANLKGNEDTETKREPEPLIATLPQLPERLTVLIVDQWYPTVNVTQAEKWENIFI